MAAAEYELADDENRNYFLKNILTTLKKIMIIFLLIHRQLLGLLTISSLTASNEVLIPVQCEFFALEGLSKLIKTIEIVKSNLKYKFKIKWNYFNNV